MANTFKKPSSLPTVTSMADSDQVLGMTSAGAFKRLSWANLKSLIKSAVTPDAATATKAEACDPVMVVMVGPTSSTVLYDKVESFAAHKAQGYTAVGILVNDGDTRFIVALDECASTGLLWSSAAGDVDGLSNISSKALAIKDSDGAANTAKILAASTASMVTNSTDHAAGFCNAYSKTAPWTAADGKTSGVAGIPAGKWYLPSLRELWAIYTHLNAVNHAISVAGGTKIPLTSHWSSTEYAAYHAWYLHFYNGYLGYNNKAANRFRVRPCAAFL